MRFREFKRFTGTTLESVTQWLTKEFNSVMRELYIGLSNLTFGENFTCFEWEGEIEPGEEKAISHTLKVIPQRFLVLWSEEASFIVPGTAATPSVFYVQNIATTSTFRGKIALFP